MFGRSQQVAVKWGTQVSREAGIFRILGHHYGDRWPRGLPVQVDFLSRVFWQAPGSFGSKALLTELLGPDLERLKVRAPGVRRTLPTGQMHVCICASFRVVLLMCAAADDVHSMLITKHIIYAGTCA